MTASSITLRYATTLELCEVTNQRGDIGVDTDYEEVGTGNNSETIFNLDQKYVIADTYHIYYGATVNNVTELTETTHYTLALNTGRITLTAAGVTAVGTNKIFAQYSYNTSGLSNSYLTSVISRAETEVDSTLNTTFTDGTQNNPDYPSVINESHMSQGLFNRSYSTENKPLIDVSSSLASNITAAATSLTVATGDGVLFPTSGSIIIGSEIITYTGVSTNTLTGLTRGVYDSTAAAHTAGDSIHTTSVQISGTDEGSTPTWYTLTWDSEVTVNEIGKVYIYDDTLYSTITVGNSLLPKQDIPNRLRISYLWGNDEIPYDITRLTLLFAQRSLWSDAILGSLIKGRNEFNPELLSVIESEANLIISKYRIWNIENT